ncbi:hypothetical protein DPMN_158215 [Dreissena polymorpha]|uniref:Uncharacterized protein n=1 Tax=Dreissena polymorpha TaxID=45954 RepID=A0A9D4EKY7_DREPO|nr:hypothetical protein DPMN_158215 [Dreissena polymorpha]
MSGWKNQGQARQGAFKPEDSSINFAVPSRSCLEESFLAQKIKECRPGVLEYMITLIKEDG